MGSRHRGALGERAEQQAFRFLIARGLCPVARNFRGRGGEIDLVMLDGQCLTFIEVRYRSSSQFVDPLLTVDQRKQRKLVHAAALFLSRHRFYTNHSTRFDVVAIDENGIRWVRDAFRPDDVTQ
ncbi:MAG TPA: YraN family protein [Woeseiaceae bacterium]|nr:YraN family protein [Woeseiaceae bacterium]